MSVPFPAAATLSLRPEDLRPHPMYTPQPKENLIIRLASSIKKYGILEPIAVRPAADVQGVPFYEIIDGHRRYQAALLARLSHIPCRVLSPADPQCAKMALVSDLKEQKLHFFEQARAFQRLMTEYRMTQEEIARYMQLSQSAVANKLRLLQLAEEHQRCIQQSALTERHARSLLRVPPTERGAVLALIIERKANVAESDRIIEAHLSSDAKAASTPPLPQFPALPPQLSFSVPEEPEGQFNLASADRLRPIHPAKFALRDLRPLYNSIERSLAIFRKTGAAVNCQRHEDETGAYILIHIPKQT
ncbi:MAG: ParB/RepB/Spo0J family partition protein [Ruminococcaceae bacterium]|nr:ParB/RepB/Spo0J family partition protein [Oscillospiraceae bacterium]